MSNKNKADEGSWCALLFSVLLPMAIAIVMVAVMLLSGCKKKEDASQWVGMDRSKVSCAPDDEVSPHRQVTCVGGGRAYKCVTEDDDTWRCAEPAASTRPVDQADDVRFKIGCSYDRVAPPRKQVSCVASGRTFKCVAEDGVAWHCVEADTAVSVEAPAVGAGDRL